MEIAAFSCGTGDGTGTAVQVTNQDKTRPKEPSEFGMSVVKINSSSTDVFTGVRVKLKPQSAVT